MMTDEYKLNIFIDECIEAYATLQHFKQLFEGRKSDLKLFGKVSHLFFLDLYKILIKSIYLQICRPTDPASSAGNHPRPSLKRGVHLVCG